MNKKKSVSDIIIDRFLKDVEEKGTMPWQRPYERYDSFNYFTQIPYRGINRLLLPFGEYMTKNQVFQYNKSHGYLKYDGDKFIGMTDDALRFVKGIQWCPVVFFKKDVKNSSLEEIADVFPERVSSIDMTDIGRYIGREGGWTYRVGKQGIIKERNILRYYEVADRHFFQNARGECLPSRIETGEIEITKQKPDKVFWDYIEREGIKVDKEYRGGVPCYIPKLDMIRLNPLMSDEDSWFATAFHEAGHSTGAKGRLNREGIVDDSIEHGSDRYAKEEVVAEICACLCCAETGIYDFKTSGMAEYDNNIAYVQSWKKRIKDWGSSFIYLVSQADKAFNYICGDVDDNIQGNNDDIV